MARQVGAVLYAAGDFVAVEEARLITTGGAFGKAHVVSLPGQPPNADTHDLDRSIETVQVEQLRVEVQTNSRHAVALQFGTSKMAARPFADVALQNKRREVSDMIVAGVSKVVRGGKVVP